MMGKVADEMLNLGGLAKTLYNPLQVGSQIYTSLTMHYCGNQQHCMAISTLISEGKQKIAKRLFLSCGGRIGLE
jgi:hypothetical protein